MVHHIKKIRKAKKTALDHIIYFFVFTTPLFELPQLYAIYSDKDATGVSLTTWAYFALSSMVWLTYGIHRKMKPIMYTYSLYCVMEITIVAGIIRY